MAMKILVVDDTEERGKLLGNSLKAQGFDVRVVKGGAEAVAALFMEDFGMILSDVNMPVMDGYQLARTVKAGPSKATPFLMYSAAQAQIGDVELALRAGVDKYVEETSIKGITDQVMLQIIKATK